MRETATLWEGGCNPAWEGGCDRTLCEVGCNPACEGGCTGERAGAAGGVPLALSPSVQVPAATQLYDACGCSQRSRALMRQLSTFRRGTLGMS